MSQLIILEGARGTGKSSIARMLRESTKHSTLINFTGFHDDGEAGKLKVSFYYASWFAHLTNMSLTLDDYSVICDRFFPSEQVFSQLYKDYDFTDNYRLLMSKLPELAEEVIVLHFYAHDEDELRERLIRDKVPFGRAEESAKESMRQQQKYLDIAEAMKNIERIKFIEIDTTGKSLEQIREEVNIHLRG